METITVTTTVDQPLETVWECWTQPEYITQWNFASEDWCCPTAVNDLRPGGRFSWRMEARDGSMGFDYAGTYLEVVPFVRILKRLDDGRQVEISFETTPHGVVITETFEAEDQNPLELQKQGWQAILDNFSAVAGS